MKKKLREKRLRKHNETSTGTIIKRMERKAHNKKNRIEKIFTKYRK
jgi:hypothetical protein